MGDMLSLIGAVASLIVKFLGKQPSIYIICDK